MLEWRLEAKDAKGEDRSFAVRVGEGGEERKGGEGGEGGELPKKQKKPRKSIIVGVADGHGGATAAEEACRVGREWGWRGWEGKEDAKEELKAFFQYVAERCEALKSGCTLTVAKVEGEGEYVVGNVGDSRALHVTPTSFLWASVSHRLQDKAEEREKWEGRVGFVVSSVGQRYDTREKGKGKEKEKEKENEKEKEKKRPVGPPRLFPGGLAVGRSLGDAGVGASTTPSICSGRLMEGDVLLVGTDGVWDALPLPSVLDGARKRGNLLVGCLFSPPRDDATLFRVSKRAIL